MSLLLIGNAATGSIPPLTQYDKVVRINAGGRDNDCDIWVNSIRYRGDESNTNKQILRLNYMDGGRHAKEFPLNWQENTTHWNSEEYNQMCEEHNLDRPSTGMMAIYYLIKNHQNYLIDIAGFTHQGANVHSWDKERDIFNQYEVSGLIHKVWR